MKYTLAIACLLALVDAHKLSEQVSVQNLEQESKPYKKNFKFAELSAKDHAALEEDDMVEEDEEADEDLECGEDCDSAACKSKKDMKKDEKKDKKKDINGC